ncbi:MAG TPA: T9SS type A sorting domain-containing protein, partial [Ignavibacteria bacterium]|nr:T9SS type A sorting domain-containing protein [Ignavibacteria bacterium]
SGLMLRTTNGGTSWVPFGSALSSSVWDIKMLNANSGYAVTSSGYIHKTIDGGATWPLERRITINTFNAVCISPDGYGFAVGNSGTMLRASNPLVGIQPVSNVVPSEFKLEQNYPNPFNPETRIRFSLPRNEKAELRIFDAAGRLTAELVNEELQAGSFEITWHAGSLPSGVYFCRLNAGKYSGTIKLVLIK